MKGTPKARNLPPKAQAELVNTLEERFTKHAIRHKGIEWSWVQARLKARPEKLAALFEMERTGGEPDVVGLNPQTCECVFVDCSAETPVGRVSVCFDRKGWESRKEHRPKSNAMDLAAAMGIELLTEEEYVELQRLGEFDKKTSSWVKTPAEIRALGGALFGERRYGRVFVGHNGAQSYYAVRGFRGVLRV